MRINLNLIPERRKKEIKNRRIVRFLIWQEFLIIFSLVVFMAVVGSIEFILNMELNNVRESNAVYESRKEFAKIKEYEQEFKKLNEEVSRVKNIHKNDFYWTNVFYELSGLVPDGIVIGETAIDQSKMKLVGTANRREDLINFQKKLGESSCFKNINVPLSDIVMKENIDFEISLNINRDCLNYR